MKQRRQEVGYVLLEECDVLIPAEALLRHCHGRRPPASSAKSFPPSAAPSAPPLWHDVDFPSSHENVPAPDRNGGGGDASDEDDGSGGGGGGRGEGIPGILGLPHDGQDLVLLPCESPTDDDAESPSSSPSASGPMSWRVAAGIGAFNGLLSKMFVDDDDRSTASSPSAKRVFDGDADSPSLPEHGKDGPASGGASASDKRRRRRRRSDASLLAGLAIEIDRQAEQYYLRQRQKTSSSSRGGGSRMNFSGTHHADDEGPHLRQLRTENARIMFWEEEAARNNQLHVVDGTDDATDDRGGTRPPAMRLTRMRASLLATFSLPIMREVNDGCPSGEDDARINAASSRGEGRGNVQKRRPVKDKMLSSGHQLLASIIRCDWGRLDATMMKLQKRALSARNMTRMAGGDESPVTMQNRLEQQSSYQKPFFPDSLNVEEMYDRISGASKHLGHGRNERKTDHACDEGMRRNTFDYAENNIGITASVNDESTHARSSEPLGLYALPEDVIATSIATYLRAPSLHALRVTSRKLYRSLRVVVPGLKLKLFRHQIRSLEWMETRERRCVTEGDVLISGQEEDVAPSSEYSLHGGKAVCGGDYHRAVTGGATTLLVSKPIPNGENGGLGIALRFDSESGRTISSPTDDVVQRKTRCARGGLLCDDPGLGKTITVISLILRTYGLRTEAEIGVDDDEKLFYSYWCSEFLTEHVRRPALLAFITCLIKSDPESSWFVPPIDPVEDCCPDYFEVISTPISLQEIRKKYNKSDCRDFRAFEADLGLCFSNAMTYNPPHHFLHQAAKRLSINLDGMFNEFKREQLKNATKSVSRMANQPSARPLVDLFEAKKTAELQESLVPSASTLLVVPAPLLHHWFEQMLLHIDFGYISNNDSPMIYYHTSKRRVGISNANLSFDLRSIASPLILIDDGSKKLPSPTVLAHFPIVITSHNRFTADWKLGSVEQEVRASRMGSDIRGVYWGEDTPEASPLLKVLWLRVIVDEGHVMGKNTNNLIQFASWISAQRHWAMTGTPTQQIATQNGLRNLFYLVNFLKHEFFNKHLGREKVWNFLINSPWKTGNLASFFRLKHLMSYLMVRHTKADLDEIPPPVFSMAFVDLSQSELTTYNTIVSSIRTNLITTSMEGKTSGWQDSLLNPRQSRYATEALTNLRIACCGGAQILPEILKKHWAETLEMLRDIHKLDDVKVQVVNNFIYRAQSAELSSCHCCGIQLQTLFVIPCGHLVCSECIDNTTKSCPICQTSFDVDDFQRLQPGLNFQFCLNLQEEKKEREKHFTLKRVLSDTVRPGGDDDIDTLGDIEIEGNAATDRQARSHRRGESCVYSSRLQDGKCTTCREEHFECNFMNSKQQCSVCYKIAEECPEYAAKSKYVIDKLLLLRNAGADNTMHNISPMAARLFSKHGSNHSMHRPLKAIVFSQFRQSYEYFGDRLIRRFGGACVADYSYAGSRAHELQKFIYQPDCFVMLLSKQGSVGLDLSFVTHIFFLDSIYDKSLEAQVVARAYRMGATGPVFVEQLTAKDSVEEVINRMNAGQANYDTPLDQKEKHAKLKFLLHNVELIRKRKQVESDKTGALISTGKKHKKVKTTTGVRFKD